MLVDDDIAHRIDPEPRDDEELERAADGFDVPRVYGEWEVCDWEPQSLGGRRVVPAFFQHYWCEEYFEDACSHPYHLASLAFSDSV